MNEPVAEGGAEEPLLVPSASLLLWPSVFVLVSVPRLLSTCILFQVIKEVHSGCGGPVDSEGPPQCSSPVHKAELEKVRHLGACGKG